MSTGSAADDPYALLGVARDASPDDLKRAFRTRARELHPDTGGDADAFRRLVEAYDLLRDPASRARHDRRGQPRSGGPFWGSHWNPGAGANRAPGGGAPPPAAHDLDLEDIFADFSGAGGPDFGFGRRPGGGGPAAPEQGPVRAAPPRAGTASSDRGGPGRATGAVPPPGFGGARSAGSTDAPGETGARGPDIGPPGADVHVAVDVPSDVAVTGGTVTVAYRRLRKALDGRNVTRTDEIHDLRVPPGTTDGEDLRVPKLGNASLGVGAVGDLVARVRIVEARAPGRMRLPPRPPPAAERAPAPPRGVPSAPSVAGPGGARGTAFVGPRPPSSAGSAPVSAPTAEPATREDLVVVDVPVADALLGGRVQVPTPTGAVQIAVPACTSSGTRLRVRGRGEGGGDILVEIRIVVPRELTPESRALVERFARIHGGR